MYLKYKTFYTLQINLNAPPYDLFDPNPYTEKYLNSIDPVTKRKNVRCDLPYYKDRSKKTEVEEEDEQEKDDHHIAYYSLLF